MTDVLNQWWFRALVTGGLTYAAFRYLPAGSIWRMVGVGIGGVATVSVLASAPGIGPMITSVMQGKLPMPTSATPPAQPVT